MSSSPPRSATGSAAPVWRCDGLRWDAGGPVLRWAGGRASRLVYGQGVGVRAVGRRACVGARGNPCPVRAGVAGTSTGGRCAECARLDRAHSVAADSFADDPRVYRVYLAWFGPGLVKVGITAEERGDARLLEQGAVAFCWLGRGALMAARRTEEVLRHALDVPDRIPYARKRAVRHALPDAEERAGQVGALYRAAVAVPEWGETLEPLEFAAYDHGDAFRLDGLPAPAGAVAAFTDGGGLVGSLRAAAGPDLHLVTADGRCVVLDTRLMRGWGLVGVDAGAPGGPGGSEGPVSVPLVACGAAGQQGGLF
ncbi:DUF2797 domain-containing protein [Streptomyces tritici]|uniref:DUF2797 domain-containing protein n=1 Tax=Streptomyces tritici TaxID=2054410 RepID=UPI003AF0DE85